MTGHYNNQLIISLPVLLLGLIGLERLSPVG